MDKVFSFTMTDNKNKSDISWAKRLLTTLKNREDSEHKQAIIRLIVGVVAASYLLAALFGQKNITGNLLPTTITITCFFIGAFFIFTWLIYDPRINKIRRLLGCCIDIISTTAALYINGNLAAPLFVVYLWVTFGNGFRFGSPYLFFSMVISLAGYCFVLFTSELWQTTHYFSYGLLVGLIVLPLYVASLLKSLRTALSEAEVASKAKSNFLATMSHEIRTPLNGIIGIIDILKQSQLDMNQQHYTTLLSKSSEWLLRVLSDGLDFTKIESDELIIDYSPTSLKEVLNNLSDVYSEIASAKSINFAYTADDKLPAAVECDKFRLLQVLNNLLANAIKFTVNGEIKLSVSCGDQDKGNIPIFFTVSDTGKGIRQDDFKTIFEPFHQAATSDSQNYGGTGLGLTIASKIIKLMGGRIKVKSSLEKGTTFSFKLNLKVTEPLQSNPSSENNLQINWKRHPVILLVEDNEVNSEVAVNLLKHFGCEVTACGNGIEALEAVHIKKFDLILMDCQMPEMDGYEATKKIRQMRGYLSEIPIIALTAHITVEDRKKCFEAGMVDYMGKPFRGEELELLLGRWLTDLASGFIKKTGEKGLKPDAENRQTAIDKNQKQALHDLRNRLTAIMGNTELALLDKDDPDEVELRLKTVLNAVNSATEIAKSLP